jgi:site-specific DNA-methyltransferase (adenine-specific)
MQSEVYLQDCIEGMKQYPDKYFDLAVVDPPYGASDALEKDKDNSKKHSAKRTFYHQFENIAPTEEYFAELKRVSKNQIVWGGNFFGLSGGVIAWNKNGTAFGEGEVAICSTHKSVRFFEYTWNGMLQQNMKDKETRIHPTQKPIALYDWIFKKYANEGDLVLDTHLGSGSSRIAARKAKLTFVGFEIDKEYFDKSNQRYKDFISQLTLEL